MNYFRLVTGTSDERGMKRGCLKRGNLFARGIIEIIPSRLRFLHLNLDTMTTTTMTTTTTSARRRFLAASVCIRLDGGEGEGRVEESVGVSSVRVSRLLTMFSCNDRVMLLARY